MCIVQTEAEITLSVYGVISQEVQKYWNIKAPDQFGIIGCSQTWGSYVAVRYLKIVFVNNKF